MIKLKRKTYLEGNMRGEIKGKLNGRKYKRIMDNVGTSYTL